MSPRLLIAIAKNELRQISSYRVAFWINFFSNTIIPFLISYFLWSSIFKDVGAQTIGGFSLEQMIFFYLSLPLLYKCILGLNMRFLFQDVYEGGLNKYLLYPVSFLGFKGVGQAVRCLYYFIQFFIIIMAFSFFWGIPEGYEITPYSVFLCLIACLVSTYLYFIFEATIEMSSFWAENVWSLSVSLQFLISLLGGRFVPIELYPEWVRKILVHGPFYLMLRLPFDALVGHLSTTQLALGILKSAVWFIIMYAISRFIWKRGLLRYSGVGI